MKAKNCTKRRTKIRKTILLISLLLFPITLNYLSPYLIIQGSFAGIATGSFLLFASLFVSSLFFGRAFCGWICPGGALQDCGLNVKDKPVGCKMNRVKHFIWIPWVIAIAAGFILAGGIKSIEPLYFTDHGISVSAPENYIVYYFVIALILGVSLIFGRRAFCHSLCWMAPFMVIGSKIKDKLKYPALHLEAEPDRCIECKLCEKSCPMSLPVSAMVKENHMNHVECILCGNCEDVCPQGAIHLKIGKRRRCSEKQISSF